MNGAFVVVKVMAGVVVVVRVLGPCAVELCSHLTWTAWLQQLHLGSNLNPAAQFLTTGSVSVQSRKVLHSGSDGFGATDPDGQAFPKIKKQL